jgi:hypothetical protein
MHYHREIKSMSHLPIERLAALADEQPTSEEQAHIAICASCAHERDAYRSLLAATVAERTRIGAPITSWDSLRPDLVSDGIIDDGDATWVAPSRRRWTRVNRRVLQVAAGVLLVAGGAIAGRWSATPAVQTAANAPSIFDSITFKDAADANAKRVMFERLYQQASSYLAGLDSATYTSESPSAIRTRLAALDRVDEVVRAALNEAPYDPVINSYYLTTFGQREAALRQLNTALPASVRVNSF